MTTRLKAVLLKVDKQVRDVLRGGIPEAARKMMLAASLLAERVLLPALETGAGPLMFLLRLALRPFVQIRYFELCRDRIGHLAIEPDIYLCERARDVPRQSSRTLDLFYPQRRKSANAYLDRLWKRNLHYSPFYGFLARSESRLPLFHPRTGSLSARDPNGVLARSSANLQMSSRDLKTGRRLVQKMGVPHGMKYVCLHTRDAAYLNRVDPNRDWRYHSFRDCSIRNYRLAIDYLVSKGFAVIRMGSVAMEEMPSRGPCIFDYSNHPLRSEFMDVFLGATCHFFIGTNSGLAYVSVAFRRPVLWVNFIPLEDADNVKQNGLFLFKKLKRNGVLMTFAEVMEQGAGSFSRSEQFADLGIEAIENSPEEILSACREMVARLDGSWTDLPGAEALVEEFRSLAPLPDLNGFLNTRIASEFALWNAHLISSQRPRRHGLREGTRKWGS